MASASTASLPQRLQGSGMRSTPQREVVYGSLLEERNHPTVDELFHRVKRKRPGISLATVYNCLQALLGCGLVRQVNFERGPSRYCPNLSEHAHLHIEATGEVTDIALPAECLTQLRDLLPQPYHKASIEITFHVPKTET